MNAIAVSAGRLTVYWNSIVIILGLLSGLLLSLSLCGKKCRASAVLCFYPLAAVFSVVFSRLIHWYSYMEQYASFAAAITDYGSGGYCITGILLGALLAGAIVRRLGLVWRVGSLFDAVIPGAVMSMAFIRLADVFGTACRSKITVMLPILQRLPFAIAATDSAGNTVYKFATFFMSFVLLLVLSLALVRFCAERCDVRMIPGISGTGNIARIGLVLFAAIEIVLDSTRSDPVSIHFAFLTMLNKYVGFISVTMFACAVSILCIFIHYYKGVRRTPGHGKAAALLLAGYIISLAGVGGTEYLVQRFTGMFVLYRSIQTLAAALMAFVVCRCYGICCEDQD